MDGLKERLNASVQFKLSFVLFLAVSVVAIAAGTFSFISAFVEAHELQDDVLYQIAALATKQGIPQAVSQNGVRLDDSDNDSTIFVQYLPGRANHNAVALPDYLSDGLHTVKVHGEAYRVLVKATKSGQRIAVAQLTEDRDDMAYDSAMRTLTPFFILVPVLLIILISLIRKMFRPIIDLATQIDGRSEQDMQPIPSHELPSEVRPFVRALNRLLERVAKSISTQQRFVADAAHELRSPLTALSLQAERLGQAEMSDEARTRLEVVQLGIERGRNLLNQLLSLSKAQSAQMQAASAVSVKAVFRQVLEDLIPQANAKGVDVGVLEGPDATVWISELDITAVVKNLTDNAIRYTPAGGRVDLSVATDARRAMLTVSDTGPGIPPSEQNRVFDPFYRILGSNQVGSGLGLSIVRAIADRTGARVELDFTDKATHIGLTVTFTLPLYNSSLAN